MSLELAALGILLFTAKDKAEAEAIAAMPDSFTRWDSLIKKHASANGIPWRMVKAICMIESSLGMAKSVQNGLANPRDIASSASSDKKSWGLMQVRPSTASDFIPNTGPVELNNPEICMSAACMYLRYLYKMFGGNLEYTVKAYNQGQGNMKKELAGTGGGLANGYWAKFQAAYSTVISKQGA